MAQYAQPRIRAIWGRSAMPMTAVTDFIGFIRKLSDTWMPTRRYASRAAQMAGWRRSGRSP